MFRRKLFTIPEGHFTGSKDMDDIPSLLHNAGKGMMYGSGIGAAVGGVRGYFDDDSSIIGGAMSGGFQGAKVGFASGIMHKFFLNYMHKPMKSIKFQEVDKNLRRQFGMYRMAGINVGDSINNRMTMDEKFGFNDRQVDNYKINIAIQNDTITMYTFGMKDKELDLCSTILDHYTKTYYGVNYTSKLINKAVNSYSVSITFTNYGVITNFIMELSQRLQTKINLMNENAIIFYRLKEAGKNYESNLPKETENGSEGELATTTYAPGNIPIREGYLGGQRNFSTPELSKSDVAKILGQTGQFVLSTGSGYKLKKLGVAGLFGLIKSTTEKISGIEAAKLGLKTSRSNYGNSYLETTLKKLHFMEKMSYTVGDKTAEDNISLINGRLIITVPTKSDNVEKIDKVFYSPNKSKITRNDTGDVIVYSYIMTTTSEFEFMINKLFSTKIKFNIFV